MIARGRCLRGERIAQRRREEEKEAKIREKAQGDVRELMDQFSSR